jgi:hypothetical protein
MVGVERNCLITAKKRHLQILANYILAGTIRTSCIRLARYGELLALVDVSTGVTVPTETWSARARVIAQCVTAEGVGTACVGPFALVDVLATLGSH